MQFAGAAEIPLGCHCSKDGLSSPLPQGDSALCLHSSNENEPLSYVGCQNHDNSTKDTFEKGKTITCLTIKIRTWWI